MTIEFLNFTENLTDSMRSVGYHFDGNDQKTGEWRFYRGLSDNLYPRFHVYASFNKTTKKLVVNLHLDQKAPVYKGSTAHSGDYDGPVIEKEAASLKMALIDTINLPKLESSMDF
ncbi:MAG: hypothetical protein Q7S83_02220 [bacterium]|nr:hypothetical protein [bacterium]